MTGAIGTRVGAWTKFDWCADGESSAAIDR